jgi:hypothetical protein
LHASFLALPIHSARESDDGDMRRLFGKRRDKDEQPKPQSVPPVRPLQEHAQPTTEKPPPGSVPDLEKRDIQNYLAEDESQHKKKGVAFAGVAHVDEHGKSHDVWTQTRMSVGCTLPIGVSELRDTFRPLGVRG